MIELLDYVKALEDRGNRSRGDAVLRVLREQGTTAVVQDSAWPRVRNIVVDFRRDPRGRHIIFSAHYDAVRGSPGANDNASGVAVLLGLCRRLKSPAPVKIVFFDREETWFRSPVLRLGLLGSTVFVLRNSLSGLEAVYNLECCGMGDSLAIWPVKGKEAGLPALAAVRNAAAALGLESRTAHLPWLFHSSDHLSFRWRGVGNALTLSLLPAGSVTATERLLAGVSPRALLTGKRPVLPEPFCYLHTAQDSSRRIAETSLQSMLAVLGRLA